MNNNFGPDFPAQHMDPFSQPTMEQLLDPESIAALGKLQSDHDVSANISADSRYNQVFDALHPIPDTILATSISTSANVARVRQAMLGGYKGAQYDALDAHELWDTPELRQEELEPLLKSLKQFDRLKFEHMTSVQLLQLFEGTCRLVDIAPGSADYLLLRAELVEPKLAARREEITKLRKRMGANPGELAPVDADGVRRRELRRGIASAIGYTVAFAVVFGFGILLGHPSRAATIRAATRLEETRWLALDALELLTPEQTNKFNARQRSKFVTDAHVNELLGILLQRPASSPHD